jgi:hypothetical protein
MSPRGIDRAYRMRSGTSLSARGRWLLDVALFAALVVASNPAWTGIGLHEWLAGLLIAPVLYHLAINWDWTARTTRKLLEKLDATTRLDYAVDVALFMVTITVMLSGFMVIPGVVDTSYGTVVLGVWQRVHKLSSNLLLLTMTIHLLLHWRWMYDVAGRSFLPKRGRHSASRSGSVAHARGRR